MSQASPQGAATAVAPAPGAPSAAAGPPAVVGAPAGPPASRSRIRDTPQRLRLLTVEVIVAGLVVGLVGALTFAYLAFSLNRAEADAAQLIRVQKIQTNLLSADATATNAFLVGGLEPPAQRAAYDQAMLAASTLIAEAAQAQPADAEALSVLNQQLVSYAASIEQARANNRQGLPIGAQYLRVASTQLRGTAIPVLDNLVQSNADRAADEMDVRIGYLAVAFALLGLAAVILIQVWVARRFRRRINLGLLLSSIVLLLAVVIGLIGVQQLNGSVKAIKDGSFTALNVAAAARIDANNAKSNESLTLIARGSGQSFETAWSAAADSVSKNLSYLVGPDRPADQVAGLHRGARRHPQAGRRGLVGRRGRPGHRHRRRLGQHHLRQLRRRSHVLPRAGQRHHLRLALGTSARTGDRVDPDLPRRARRRTARALGPGCATEGVSMITARRPGHGTATTPVAENPCGGGDRLAA